jgi:wyosine [tRNA(Phe)-imidazoG37] synthetase (radical SAM superfamily)
VLEVLSEAKLLGRTKLVLITNGSLIHRSHVEQGLSELAGVRGEAWFKLDSATETGLERINGCHTGLARLRTNLSLCAGLIPTWIQTCLFSWKGEPPSEPEQASLVEFLGERVSEGVPLRGVLLYGLARPSHQPEASELARLPAPWLEAFGDRLRSTGLEVRVFP